MIRVLQCLVLEQTLNQTFLFNRERYAESKQERATEAIGRKLIHCSVLWSYASYAKNLTDFRGTEILMESMLALLVCVSV